MTGHTPGNTTGATEAKGILIGQYAERKKALNATINELRSLGAAVEVDLPTIVVAGNQSSGKSSLIEAISGISLPRASGTCTKVPTEVRLKQQDDVEWSCQVSIRREAGDHDEIDGKKPEATFGPKILDRKLLENTIRRAQLAILNPSVAPHLFVDYILPAEEEDNPLGSAKQNAFSTDVIVLEITGPDMIDLTLVDLPGIIQNVKQGEDPKNIPLVANMVRDYILKDCLILLVITMKDDIENQKAALLAREADPTGRRTIGVLTKVDTVTGTVDTDAWLKVVKNEREPLSLGYFASSPRCTASFADYQVTKQPDADTLVEGISFADARKSEDDFFHQQSPWKKLDPKYQRRLGTKNLADFLSDKLSSFIQDRLPGLEKQIADRHREVEADLKKLGEPPSENPTSAVLLLLSTFQTTVGKHVEGHTGYEAFMQDINQLRQRFAKEIKDTKPKFSAAMRAEAGSSEILPKADNALAERLSNPQAAVYLDDMRMHINRCRTRELPDQLPPSALAKLIVRSTSTWDYLAVDLLERVKPSVETLLLKLIHDLFGKYEYGRLPGAITSIITEHVERLFKDTQVIIQKMVAAEMRPSTQNDHYLTSNRNKILASLKTQRTGSPATQPDPAEAQRYLTAAVANLAAAGRTGIKEEDLAKLGPIDEYETEMELMAHTGAYWKVAYKRIIDTIPSMIDKEFLTPLAEVLHDALVEELQVFEDNAKTRCAGYLAEAPDIAEMRMDLTVRKGRLAAAKLAIRRFTMKQ